MTWFFIALLGPFFWAVGNFIDKLLVRKMGDREHAIGVLTIYSSLFSFLVLAILVLFTPLILTPFNVQTCILIIAGILELGAIVLYLIALREEDTSIVVPIFQTIPIFTFILGLLFLDESLNSTQVLAGIGIIVGGILLATEFNGHRFIRIKYRVLFLMIGSSFLYALYYFLFKYAALTAGFWNGVFWQHVGVGLTGLVIFVTCKHYRKDFLKNIKVEGLTIFSLNFVNEGIYALGIILFNFALLLAPLALVGTVYAYQPIFVFLLGMGLTLLVPGVIKEKVSTSHLIQKITTISAIVGASILLTLAG